jgi:acid stress-induced BolA-like protein IbaG/YrbA
MLVCERGHIPLVLTVLDLGAVIDFQQKVVLSLKVKKKSTETINVSVQTTGQSAIYVAAKLGHSQVVRFLLAYGAHYDLMDWVRWKSVHALSIRY